MATLRKDGRLQSSVTVTNPFTGAKDKKYAYGYTEEELAAEKARIRKMYENAVLSTTDMTFKDWCDEWIRLKKENDSIAETTEESYRGTIDRHILPNLPEGIKLSQITIYHVKNILRNIKTARTKEYTYTILNGIFRDAMFEQILMKNPCDFIRKPKAKPVRADIILPEYYFKLMEEIKGTQWQYLYSFAWDSGARRGEIGGLRWTDFDEDNAKIVIERTMKKTKEKGQFVGKTKSDYSERELTLTPAAVANLVEWRKILRRKLFEAGLPWYDDDFIFRSFDLTKPIKIGSITSMFAEFRKKLGLPKTIRFHSFRHTHGTVLAEQDLSPKKIQARLGHSSAAFTMDTYVHKSSSMQDGVVEALKQKEKTYQK